MTWVKIGCVISRPRLQDRAVARAGRTWTRIVRWPRIPRSVDKVAASVDAMRDSSDRTSASVNRLLQELQVERLDARRRRWLSVSAGIALALLAGASGWGLLLASTPQTSPAVSPTGRIGIVSVGSLPESIVRVDADFSASSDEPGSFSIVVSVYPSPAQDLLTSTFKPTIGFLFCGDLREGLTLTEANHGRQPSPTPVTGSTIFDSVVGERAECDYLEITGITSQVALSGSTDTAFASTEGSRVLYAFPGVVAPFLPESINASTAIPLPSETEITVSLRDIPADLQVSQSMPQIPADGQLSWTSTLGSAIPPSEYRVSGVLENAQASASVGLFAAGALVGIAGAAVLWVMESAIGIIRKPRL